MSLPDINSIIGSSDETTSTKLEKVDGDGRLTPTMRPVNRMRKPSFNSPSKTIGTVAGGLLFISRISGTSSTSSSSRSGNVFSHSESHSHVVVPPYTPTEESTVNVSTENGGNQGEEGSKGEGAYK